MYLTPAILFRKTIVVARRPARSCHRDRCPPLLRRLRNVGEIVLGGDWQSQRAIMSGCQWIAPTESIAKRRPLPPVNSLSPRSGHDIRLPGAVRLQRYNLLPALNGAQCVACFVAHGLHKDGSEIRLG